MEFDGNSADLLDNVKNNCTLKIEDGKTKKVQFHIDLNDFSLNQKIDFGILSLDKFNVKCSFIIDVTLKNKSGKISIDEFGLDKLNFELSVGVSKASLGLFDANFTNGELKFSVCCQKNGPKYELQPGEVKLSYNELALKSGVVSLYESSKYGEISYDFAKDEWVFPNDIKQLASFSGENLATQVYTVVNTLQTALRSLVESKTQLDFLDGSIDKIVDIVDKVEQVFYGDTDANVNGLLKCVNGSYVSNFVGIKSDSSLSNDQSFQKIFNDAWESVFNVRDVCTVVCKNKNGDEIDTTTSDKKAVSYKIKFNLSFKVDKEFGLNFANALSTMTNGLANITTSGYVSAKGEAGIEFALDLKLNSSPLTGNETVGSFISDKDLSDLKNDVQYIEFKTNKTKSFEKDIEFVVDVNGNAVDVTILEGKTLESNKSDWYYFDPKKANSVEICYTSLNQICITANGKFDFKSSADADAFAELKLTGTNLQTTALMKDCAEDGVINVSFDNLKDTLSISLDEVSKVHKDSVNYSLSTSNTSWIEWINEYLSLQKTDGLDSCITDKNVAVGRSIMNTYGLYVVDVIKKNGKLDIRFGCDPRRLQDYATDAKGSITSAVYLLKDSSNKITYMRLSSEVVGNGLNDKCKLMTILNLDRTTGAGGSYQRTFNSLYEGDSESDAIEKVDEINAVLYTDGVENYYKAYYKAYYKEVNGCSTSVYKVAIGAIEQISNDKQKVEYYLDVSNSKHYALITLLDGSKEKVELKVYDSKPDLTNINLSFGGCDKSYVLINPNVSDVLKNRIYAFEPKIVEVKEKNASGTYVTKYLVTYVVSQMTGSVYKVESDLNSVKYSDKWIEIYVQSGSGSASCTYVNTDNCLTASSVANAIEKALVRDNMTCVKSVSVVDENIVFTTDTNVSVTCDALGNSNQTTNNEVSFGSATATSINLSKAIKSINEKGNLDQLLAAINNVFASSGYEITYTDIDGTTKLDHLEIRCSDKTQWAQEFTLNVGVGGSNPVLSKLGFSTYKSVLVDGVHRIIGSTLLTGNLSDVLSIDEKSQQVKVYANAELFLDTGINVTGVTTSGNTAVLKISPDERVCNVDGFVKVVDPGLVNGEYYRITKVNANKDNKVVSIEVQSTSLNSKQITSSTSGYTFVYAASASASAGFLGVDVIADGAIKIDAKFELEKTDKDDADVVGFKINKSKSTLDVGEKNGTSTVKDKFSFWASADLLGSTTKIIEGDVAVKNISDSYVVDASIKTNNFQALYDQFQEFSIEQLLGILENLITRIESITRNTQSVKIPLINKSIGDLANVANDLSSVVKSLREEKISSIQAFGNLLNSYLLKSHLTSTSGGNLFELKYENNQIKFVFDVRKEISSQHSFSFGSSGNGVNGNVDLDITGGLWFKLEATFGKNQDGAFDLKVDDAIKFGADIAIAGDKLSFDLGVDSGNSSLLSNLISVGADGKPAFIYGKASLSGEIYGKDNLGAKQINFELSEKNSMGFSYSIPIAIYGRLPISVCNMSLGEIIIGKCNNGAIGSSAWTSFEKVVDEIDSALKSVDPKYVVNDLAKVGFGLKTSDSDNFDGKLVVDFSSVYEKIEDLKNFNSMDWFDKIKLAVTGLNSLFDMLEGNLNSGMADSIKSVPVVGSALSSGVDFLTVLKNKVLDPFSKFVYESSGLSVELVAKKMNELFKGYFMTTGGYTFGWTDSSEWNQINDAGTWYRKGSVDGDSYAEWFFNLGGTYAYGTDIAFDLGLPGLGLKSDAGLSLSLSWCLEFGFGISKNNGFYFIFGDGDEIKISASAVLNGTVDGSLAGLGLALDTSDKNKGRKAAVTVDFAIDLNKGVSALGKSGKAASTYPNKKTESHSYDAVKVAEAFKVPAFSYNAQVNINADIQVGINGNFHKYPSISGVFEFNALADQTSGLKISSLGFKDLSFDMGSFISGVLSPIVAKIQQVVKPLESLIDFLTTPFPVLKDLGIKITPLDLAKKYSKGKFDDSMIYAIKDLIKMSNQISAVSGKSISIDLGNFYLVREKDTEHTNESAENFLNGKTSASSFDDKALENYADKLKDSSISESASSSMGSMGFDVGNGSWSFIWNHASDLFKYLMGQDVDLVTYRMPKLSFDFDWNTFVRIYGPLGARLGVTFSASIQLSFGYDTLGFRQWMASGRKDYGCLLNGIYVSDLDENGNDINELSFYGGLTAAAELNAGIKAGVGGGVGINVGINLFDPNKDGKIRLNEIKQTVMDDGLFGMFDVNGKITAKLYAYVDLLFYTKKWNITDDITLFSFDYKHKPIAVMATADENGNVIASVGSKADNRIYSDDVNKTLTDGDESLDLEIDGKTIYWAKRSRSVSVSGDGKLIVDAGAGKDCIKLTGKADFDIEIHGGEGDDTIDLSGLDMLNNHVVIIWGDAGKDKITGAKTGLNIIFGDTGVARIDKDEENDDVFVVEGNVEAGYAGDDIIIGGSNRDIVIGGAGDDSIDGGAGDDVILGDGGKVAIKVSTDKLGSTLYKEISSAKNDGRTIAVSRTEISLDGGNDYVVGSDGDDILYGGSGNDHIAGGAGNDVIYGDKGNDRILGGSGDDFIHGGEGSDIIFGDKIDNKSLNLISAFDESVYSDEFKISQFSGSGANVTTKEFSKNLSEIKDSGDVGIDKIFGDEGDDLIFGDNGGKDGNIDYIEGGLGNDIIDGDGGDDTIKGGIGNDFIYGGLGSDIIDGGAGNDTIYGDEGYGAYNNLNTASAFAQDQITFGENFGIGGKIYRDVKSDLNNSATTSTNVDGDDKIMTGPGMDFVDGQGGNDQIIVNLKGGSETSYANITDSGADDESNVLTIEGTEYDDTLLMRRNATGTLGFVALLPEKGSSNVKNANENIERVNFTSNVNVVNLNANGGNDKIYVDGTAKLTNIDGGAGDDSFQVGQMYNSERTTEQGVATEDVFETLKNSDEKYLSNGVTSETALNIEGGIGNDSFTSLHNEGSVSMSGGLGKDSFALYNYSKRNGDALEAIICGAISIDGGKDIDSLRIAGTNGDDTVVVTKDGVLSNTVGIKASGVETSTFDAAAGDDLFYVLGNNEGEETTINGGHGHDTVSVGGIDVQNDLVLRSAEVDGQVNTIKYEIIESGSDEAKKNSLTDFNDKFDSSKTYTESYKVYDTQNEPVVFVSKDSCSIDSSTIEVEEGDYTLFYICYSGDLKGNGCIAVTLSAPMLSTSGAQSGDGEILIGKRVDGETSVDLTDYGSSVTVYLDGSHSCVGVKVKALSDKLLEEDVLKTIMMSSVWTYSDSGTQKSVALTNSASAFSVLVKDKASVTTEAQELKKLFASTDEYKITESTISLGEIAVGFSGDINVSIKGVDGFIIESTQTYSIDKKNGKLIFADTFFDQHKNKNEVLVVNYRSNTMRLDGTKLRLAYDNVKALNTVKYSYTEGSKTIVNEILTKDALDAGTNLSGVDTSVYYALNGNVLVFFNSSNDQLMTLHGNIEIEATEFEYGVDGVVPTPSAMDDFLVFTPHQKTLAEQYCRTEVDAATGKNVVTLEGSTCWNTTSYNVSFKESIDDNYVYVKLSVSDVIAKVGNTLAQHLDVTVSLNGTDLTRTSDGCYILKFSSAKESYSVSITAKFNNVADEYGIVTVVSKPKNLDDIAGSVYAYGEGASMTADFDSPEMLRYNHKFSGTNNSVLDARKLNEKNNYDEKSMATVKSITGNSVVIDVSKLGTSVKIAEGDTIKLVQGNLTSDWNRIEKVTNSGSVYTLTLKDSVVGFSGSSIFAILSGKKDYLFDAESECTDRIFVNNQNSDGHTKTYLSESEKLDENGNVVKVDKKTVYVNDEVKFTQVKVDENNADLDSNKQWKGKIIANNFEFGEFNLGKGKDNVNISKTLYRDEDTQTITVVNTGDGKVDGDDNVIVSSYRKGNDGLLVINAQDGKDNIDASGSGITKDGMVVIGGAGEDEIKVNKGVIAFGDKGNIKYEASGKTNPITNLGYDDRGEMIYTGIAKGDKNYLLQTDGVVRSATSIKSVDTTNGAKDVVTAGGRGSIVVGGAGDDKVTVSGTKNIVVGDNGEIKFFVGSGNLNSVTTIDNKTGNKDDINVSGKNNVVMGGAATDTITIDGSDNVVLGDGGIAEFVDGTQSKNDCIINANIKKVETTDDGEGAKDVIHIYGGNNTVMGGAGADKIFIGSSSKFGHDDDDKTGERCNANPVAEILADKNVVLGDGGVYSVDRSKSEITLETKDLKNVSKLDDYVDTIKINGSENTVMGGTAGDTIDIFGDNNIVLGDGGKSIRELDDSKQVYDSIKSVATTSDEIGEKDVITIYGGKNAVMGGAGTDQITIGENGKNNGNKNVVLGDGGKYEVNKASNSVTVETNDLTVTNDKKDTYKDTVTIYGGQNTVMGGMEGDIVDIHGSDNIVLGDGGQAIREWNSENKIYDKINSVKTTNDDNGGHDEINIHGGKNAVMGGAADDEINIGDKNQNNGNENVVLGDGGSYVVNRDAKEVTVNTSYEKKDGVVVVHGDADTINVYGGHNTVMGGVAGDKIDIFGGNNIVLGDEGEAVREWTGDDNIYDSIKSVTTAVDNKGGDDKINIHGGKNAVMGGAADDEINIGDKNQNNGNENVVLGDGGSYVIDRENKEVTVQTSHEETKDNSVLVYGGEDHINIYGGENTVMGGTMGDSIDIYGSNNVTVGDGGVAVRDWTEESDIFDSTRTVYTTDDSDGGVDTVTIYGGKNIAMGGADGDEITISGANNVAVGDNGKYVAYTGYQTVNSKSESDGGVDIIKTGDGKNVVLGGMEADEIDTGNGNDIILGDGGFVVLDNDRNAMLVTNKDYNLKAETVNDEGKTSVVVTGGADRITTTGGDNVIMGGMNDIGRVVEGKDELSFEDVITSGDGKDTIFGDNAYATFNGNANLVNNESEKYSAIRESLKFENAPEIHDVSTLSFNFQGAEQNGLDATETAGAVDSTGNVDFAVKNWNNIAGSIAGTYGNDDNEIVRFDNGTRASAVSVSYAGHEDHRNTSTDNRINLQGYNLNLANKSTDSNAKMMNSGLTTSAPNSQCGSVLEVSVDGLAQYYVSYKVAVYLDLPEAHSWAGQSIRKVTLTCYNGVNKVNTYTYFVNDYAERDFDGQYVLSKYVSAESIISDMAEGKKTYGNYVVFDVNALSASDRIVVTIEDGYETYSQNGKDLPGIAGIQIKGVHHKQDVAVSTDIAYGGNDIVWSKGGNDVVVGGIGNDNIKTFNDDRHGIDDNDVVFGDDAVLVFTDRDGKDDTATVLSYAESIQAINPHGSYDDVIDTGDGNDVVVGGIGGDKINAGATSEAEMPMDGVKALSINFTVERANSSNSIAQGESAGVVIDNDWHNMFIKNGELHELTNYNSHTVDGVDVTISSYNANTGRYQNNVGNYGMTNENYDELDGDTANSKLYNSYLAGQQNDEIKLTLNNIDQFRANNGLKEGSACDLYIYLGGDNADTDTYNYIYQISLGNGADAQYRYLNDWTGQTFDGDYKEASCASSTDALASLNSGATPMVSLIGNYVVFRNFTGNVAEIYIKNFYTLAGQNPKNLPLITAVQIVAGENKGVAAIGGDHDKDLVFGDDAKLTFDIDVPYAADEDLSKYSNRVIEAKSMAINNWSEGFKMVRTISTKDEIDTGKDRDVVVGGESADTIKTGSGDDIAIGSNANLIVEHNNPIGVFTPNTEIVLDQHTIDQTIHRSYLDNDNANVQAVQDSLNRNGIQGIDIDLSLTEDRYDEIDAGDGRNLVYQGNESTKEIKLQTKPMETSTEMAEYTIGQGSMPIVLRANETVKLICEDDYPKGNQWYTPNVVLVVNRVSGEGCDMLWKWSAEGSDGSEEEVTVETGCSNYFVVNIPDQPNTEEGYVIYVTASEDVTVAIATGNN